MVDQKKVCLRIYPQLTQEQSYQVSVLLKIGQPQTEIAEVIGNHKITINRELHHNLGQRGQYAILGVVQATEPGIQEQRAATQRHRPRICEQASTLDWSPRIHR